MTANTIIWYSTWPKFELLLCCVTCIIIFIVLNAAAKRTYDFRLLKLIVAFMQIDLIVSIVIAALFCIGCFLF